jgi:hypothetical protein
MYINQPTWPPSSKCFLRVLPRCNLLRCLFSHLFESWLWALAIGAEAISVDGLSSVVTGAEETRYDFRIDNADPYEPVSDCCNWYVRLDAWK